MCERICACLSVFVSISLYIYVKSDLIPSSPSSPLRLGWKGPTGRDDFGFLTFGVANYC